VRDGEGRGRERLARRAPDGARDPDLDPPRGRRPRPHVPREGCGGMARRGTGLTRVTKWNPPGVATPVGRYSQAVATETGDAVWIHVAGQIAVDADGTLVGVGDLGAQTAQVFENLRVILE